MRNRYKALSLMKHGISLQDLKTKELILTGLDNWGEAIATARRWNSQQYHDFEFDGDITKL